LKAAYEKEKIRLMYGDREKVSLRTRLRRAIMFTNKDFNELVELDREYEDEDDEEYDDDDEEEEEDEGPEDTSFGPKVEHIGPVVDGGPAVQKGLRHCQSCGDVMKDSDKFCMGCGTPVQVGFSSPKAIAPGKMTAPVLPPGTVGEQEEKVGADTK